MTTLLTEARPTRSRWHRGFGLLSGLFLATQVTAAAPLASPAALPLPDPAAGLLVAADDGVLGQLRAVETRLKAVAEKAIRTTVGLRFRAGSSRGPVIGEASGVIVTSDGYVMTVGHNFERPGQRIWVVLHDGTEYAATSLGRNGRLDFGLIKIDEPGDDLEWAELSPASALVRNQMLFAVGHPEGVKENRHGLVRLGAVTRVDDLSGDDQAWITTTCKIAPGDSGGPVFDLAGRVVGISSRIERSTAINRAVPAERFVENWSRLVASQSWDPDPSERRSRRRGRPAPRETAPLEDVPNVEGPPLIRSQAALTIPGGFYTRRHIPTEVREAAWDVGDNVRNGVVRLVQPDMPDSIDTLAVAVGADLLLTKASDLERPDVQFIIDDANWGEARVVARDRDYDLALLRTLKPHGLTPVDFNPLAPVPGIGSIVLAPHPERSSRPRVGTISHEARAIERRQSGFLGVGPRRGSNDPLIGSIVEGSGAERAGLRVGDIVKEVNGRAVTSWRQFVARIQESGPEDALRITYERDGREYSARALLGARDDFVSEQFFAHAADAVRLSTRRGGFPVGLRHDIDLSPSSCGGPLVDLEGNVVGLNISRIDRPGSISLPSSVVAERLAWLKAIAKDAELGE